MKTIFAGKLVAPFLIIALLVIALPVGSACDSEAAGYPTMNLVMQAGSAEDEQLGMAAIKFKELIEEYTAGKVTVDLYFNREITQSYNTLDKLRAGDIDILVDRPVASWDPGYFGYPAYLPGLVVNIDHGRAVINDPAVRQIMVDRYAEQDVRFLSYIEGVLYGGYMSEKKLTDFTDLKDVRFPLYYYVSPYDPLRALFWTLWDEVFWELMPGREWSYNCIETAAIYAAGIVANDYDYYGEIPDNLNYYLLREMYLPGTIAMNMDVWNEMPPKLRDLIYDIVISEVQVYAREIAVEHHRAAVFTLNENLESVNVINSEREQEVWELLNTSEGFQELKASLDPEIVEIIDGLRPASPTLSQDTIDILAYAGIR